MDARDIIAKVLHDFDDFGAGLYGEADAILNALAANQLAVVGREPTEDQLMAMWRASGHVTANNRPFVHTHVALDIIRRMYAAISPSPVSTGDRR